MKLSVIGDPIAHSLSPIVHGAVLDRLGLEWDYQKINVKRGALGEFLTYAKAEGLDGFNLTMPHKLDILPYLDEIDAEAQRFHSVNTVRICDGKLYGYNTDADGYTTALWEAHRERFDGKRVVILGAGGAARTILQKAAYDGAATLTLLNRTRALAETVAQETEEKTKKAVTVCPMEIEAMRDACAACDLLINATPLGMQGVGSDFEDLSFITALPPTALVSDLIYKPDETRFLAAAKRAGHRVLNGLGMLIFQAMLADEIYLNRSLDKSVLYPSVCAAVREEIQSTECMEG